MKLKLKEEPKEWLKFTAVMAGAASIVLWVLVYRAIVARDVAIPIWTALGLAVLVCACKPAWFRWFYRRGMTVSFHLGQVMGTVMLTVFFIFILTPLGLFLRLLGKDLLDTKPRKIGTYWSKPRPPGPFDRQF
jgi:hypothetical protein